MITKIKAPILYNFKPYDSVKRGLFSIHKDPGVFKLPGGWEEELQEYDIIGEHDTAYVYALKPTTQGQWVGNKVIEERFILPKGIHKSRLVKWLSGQLCLFDG